MVKEENMIELYHDELAFSFPEVHNEAKLNINFQRTLRIPDDGKDYPLPPGLVGFPCGMWMTSQIMFRSRG